MEVAWSFTSLGQFETCPWQYYQMRVLKEVKDTETEEQRWGNYVHKAFELRVRDGTPLPETLRHHEPVVGKIVAAPGRTLAEQKIALTSGYAPTTWFAKDVWCRCVVDLAKINGSRALALDYKTGKRKPDSTQLRLFAGALFAAFPEVDTVSTGFLWLKDDKVDKDLFTRDQLPILWGEFLPRVRRLEQAFEQQRWVKKPSGLCKRWCPVGRSRCEYCGV